MSGKLRLLGLLTVLTALLVGGAAAADPDAPTPTAVHYGTLSVRHPEAPTYQGQGAVLVPPPLMPTSSQGYVPHQTGPAITSPDSRPIAQLATLPANLQFIDVKLPPLRGPKADELLFTIQASIRYTVSGHHVLVTTYRPSPAAAQRVLGLGNQTVQLANGSTAWLTTNLDPPYPGGPTSQVVYVQDDLIVTVASDLAPNQLRAFATTVTLRR